jgi:hypothetical protein
VLFLKVWPGYAHEWKTHGDAPARQPRKNARRLAMYRTSCLILLAVLGAACADNVIDVGADLGKLGTKTDTKPGAEPTAEGNAETQGAGMVTPSSAAVDANCPSNGDSHYAGCITGAKGEVFPVDGTLVVLDTAPPYGLSFRFLGGIKLDANDLTTEGASAAIRVYAAPGNVKVGCFPEDDERNRVPARAVPTELGGMQVYVDEELPSGTQVVITLQYAGLLASQVPLPPNAPCSWEECAIMGFAARFYVGAVSSSSCRQR